MGSLHLELGIMDTANLSDKLPQAYPQWKCFRLSSALVPPLTFGLADWAWVILCFQHRGYSIFRERGAAFLRGRSAAGQHTKG
ncbi:hypothetical protein BHJ80_16110 [Escherichia coli]|nr:hypothetical protein BHJ80_16110 [Escherichia coli]